MKATEQYFPVVLFIVLYKVVLTFECVDEILQCDQKLGRNFPSVALFLSHDVFFWNVKCKKNFIFEFCRSSSLRKRFKYSSE